MNVLWKKRDDSSSNKPVKSDKSKKEEEAPSTAAQKSNRPEPQERKLRYGTATEPDVSEQFRGRKGWWVCEMCDTSVKIEQRTRQFVCANCQTMMYTVPDNECPAEKLRRYLAKQKLLQQRQQKGKEET